MEENKMQKPLILEMDEVKQEMIQVINHAIHVRKLPCYLIDMVLSDLCTQIADGAKQELTMAKEQMEKQSDEEMA